MNQNEENINSNDKGKNPFSLPDNYFSSFSQRMMHKIELAEELKEFELLSSLDKALPFVTPENYFEQSSLITESKAELSSYETLVSIKKQNAFATPNLYFQESAKAIQNKIELAEELKQYATLNSIEKQNVFTIPQNYFENVSYIVREKITAEQNNSNGFGKVLHLVFSKKTAYALAAMLVLSLGLYFYNYNSSSNTTVGDCKTLACMEKNDLLKDNQLIHLDDESLMEIVNPESLSKNLKNDRSSTEKEKEADKNTKEDYLIENTDVNDIL